MRHKRQAGAGIAASRPLQVDVRAALFRNNHSNCLRVTSLGNASSGRQAMKFSRSRVMTAACAVIVLAVWFVAVPVAQGQTGWLRPAQAARADVFGSVEIGVSVQDVAAADAARLKLPF